ncbi:MAG: hypothetical protein V4722_25975 [Bacteroidota bacterium]
MAASFAATPDLCLVITQFVTSSGSKTSNGQAQEATHKARASFRQ